MNVPPNAESDAGQKLARIRLVMDEWEAALDKDRCPSCGRLAQLCDHGEGYHHALSDLYDALTQPLSEEGT